MQRSVGAFSADRGDEIDVTEVSGFHGARMSACLLYTSDAADE